MGAPVNDPIFILQAQLQTANLLSKSLASEAGFERATRKSLAAPKIDQALVAFTITALAMQTEMAAIADDLFSILAEIIVSGGGAVTAVAGARGRTRQAGRAACMA